MKRQIKKILTILLAVLFVATLTASAVSAEEAVTLTDSAVSLEEVATQEDFSYSIDDGFSCGNEPWWWWLIHHHRPWPPGPVDPNPPDPAPDYSHITESINPSFKQSVNFQ
jgi:hypothetical protein